MEPLSIALLGILGTAVVGTGWWKINGRKAMTKDNHETICKARLTPMRDDLKTIKKDVKDILKYIRG